MPLTSPSFAAPANYGLRGNADQCPVIGRREFKPFTVRLNPRRREPNTVRVGSWRPINPLLFLSLEIGDFLRELANLSLQCGDVPSMLCRAALGRRCLSFDLLARKTADLFLQGGGEVGHVTVVPMLGDGPEAGLSPAGTAYDRCKPLTNATNDKGSAMSICPHPCPSGPTGPPGRRLGVGLGLSPSIPVRSKRLELGLPAGSVTLVLGKLSGGAGRRSNGRCRVIC